MPSRYKKERIVNEQKHYIYSNPNTYIIRVY